MVLDSLPYIDDQLGLPEGRVDHLLDVADGLIDEGILLPPISPSFFCSTFLFFNSI